MRSIRAQNVLSLSSRESSIDSPHPFPRLKRLRSISGGRPGSRKRPRPDSNTPADPDDNISDEFEPSVSDGSDNEKDDDEEDDDDSAQGRDANAVPGKKYKEIIDHGLGDALVILPELKALICRHCHYTVSAGYIDRHFREQSHPKSFSAKALGLKMKDLGIPLDFKPDPPPSRCVAPLGMDPISYWKCETCQGLFNPDSTTFDRHQCPSERKNEVLVCHWTKKKVFEVVADTSNEPAGMTVRQWAAQKLLELEERAETRIIASSTPAACIHPFLIRSGWVEFLRDMQVKDLETLKESAALPPPNDPIRVLLHRVFQELHIALKEPSSRGFQYHLFTKAGWVSRDHRSIRS